MIFTKWQGAEIRTKLKVAYPTGANPLVKSGVSQTQKSPSLDFPSAPCLT
ncbi:hypothetical protein ACFLXX_02650 [Chloroflexota bacterium]